VKQLFAVLLLVACTVMGCTNPRVTRANYEKIREGMTAEEVEALLGKPTRHHKNKLYYRGKYGDIEIELEDGRVEDKDWDDRD